ncbi:enoyl-CoA hydratase/isomerase family protein [Agrilutibacter solisilvae]|uniref:Enoyl-CoA hydratase/isomerase family protein n=1 Tax=Agrilutibacter solisilvae TaxID=2763317 RepID=A0A974XYL6_9GAMM|nr:enoyl-CoA hydratase/isomerase family protein [Lysobacter solisilvae]QSX77298.1 enoyl-CoA hydratase/isomerase family protein [Lysobacter solisilvae]
MSIELLRHDGDIVELQMARAPVNALDPALCRALTDAIGRALADGARGLVLSGNPKVFSAGLDVPHLLSLGEDRDALMAAWETFFEAARTLAASPVPVVAAMAGHAPAGGCVLALCCDYRVMGISPDPAKPLRIGLNETQVGLVAPEGIQHLMRRVVGQHRADLLLVTGELVDASRALAIGLVDELVAADEVTARAVAWLQDLLKLPRQPVLQTRAIARADVIAALAPARIDLPRFIDAWTAPDTQAGLRALVARLGK